MSGPILAYQYPVFQPVMRVVTAITNAFPALVTTSFAHNYVTGTVVRLIVPPGFGMTQANQLYAPIIVTSSTQFTIAIDTTQFTPFTTPSVYPQTSQYAQCIPFGENNDILTAAYQNVLPYSANS